MRARGALIRAVIDFRRTDDVAEQQKIREQIAGLLDVAAEAAQSSTSDKPHPATARLLESKQYPLRHITSGHWVEINSMLPWAALTGHNRLSFRPMPNGSTAVQAASGFDSFRRPDPVILRRLVGFVHNDILDETAGYV
ncbi:hypothetical protein [Erythrobacter sp. R86502]|uniref:hypothetical protein n=1 Tax=Erythrobacter sp. R86502 TaxID=3093846 RepID=UPI0036D34D83